MEDEVGVDRPQVPVGVLVALGLAALASLAWSVAHRGEMAELRHDVDRLVVVGAVVVVATVSNLLGVGLMLRAAGPEVAREVIGPRGGRRVRGLPGRLRRAVDTLAGVAHRDRRVMVGFLLSSVGGLAPSLVVTVALVGTLPPGSWGLALVPAVDFGLSAAARLAVHRRLLGGAPLRGAPGRGG